MNDGDGGPGRLSRSLLTTSLRITFHKNHVAAQKNTTWRIGETMLADLGGEQVMLYALCFRCEVEERAVTYGTAASPQLL